MKYKSIIAAMTALSAPTAFGVVVTTTGSDGFGNSSLNSAGVWDSAAAPSAGNDYVVTTGHRVRTPADGSSHTFAGDSLTISDGGTAGDLIGLSYKGTGGTGTITIGNLILDGGSINHISGGADVFNLDGSITVASDSLIYAKQGPVNILAPIAGTGSITNPGSDDTGRTLSFLSTTSTFTGNLVNDGRFALADDAVFNFDIDASGVNNAISGVGAETAFNGDFAFDLAGASSGLGDSWAVASAAGQTFGSTFTVSGFSDNGNDTWSSGSYLFDEGTGTLTVVPEPSIALLGGLGLLGLLRRRRI